MAQLVTRVDDELAAAVDRLVDMGEVVSRSDAVRIALEALIDERRRAAIGRRTIEGYQRVPERGRADLGRHEYTPAHRGGAVVEPRQGELWWPGWTSAGRSIATTG